MMPAISCHRFITGYHRAYTTTAKGVSKIRQTRNQLLRSIYGPAIAGLHKDSEEYNNLAKSGMVWETYFQPGNLEPYLKAQKELKDTLKSLDDKKRAFQARPNFIQNIIVEHAQQSCSIERNPLSMKDAYTINRNINRYLDTMIETEPKITTIADMAQKELPSAKKLLNSEIEAKNAILELRNHIVTSRFATKLGLDNPGTAGFSLTEVFDLAKMMLRDTDAVLLYTHGWGERVPFGSFRTTPISVKSNPLRIFPYHVEVPTCMERWIEWRNTCHELRALHPVVLATQLASYFVHIHPFPDGNGRLCKVMMADYLVRQGYLPIAFMNIQRKDYLGAQSAALDGEPMALCAAVCRAQLETYDRLGD